VTVVGGRRSPAGRGSPTCVCEHGPGVHPSTGPCHLHTQCGCRGWEPAPDHAITHECQRSDEDGAALWALTLFGHLSGDNRAQLGYPLQTRIQALRLSGEKWLADDLEFALAKRASQEAGALPIPEQRRPHPLELRRERAKNEGRGW
jgi:hypothetical protein